MVKYAFHMDNVAKAYGKGFPISRKHSYEIARYIRGKEVKKVKFFLEQVMKLKMAVPYARHNRDLSHRPGMSAGRYPVKAAYHFLKLIQSAEANAKSLGMDLDKLHIVHVSVHKGERALRNGRKNRSAKRANIQIALGYLNEEKEKTKRNAKKEKNVEKSKNAESKSEGSKSNN